MKRILAIVFLLLSFASHCQSWQWGKRGGALEQLAPDYLYDQEQTYSLITDGNKNIYGLSRVGASGLNIDNVVKSNFDSGAFPSDFALYSFGCDGSYRWSKIIGGNGNETVNALQVDNQNNVYVSGKFSECQQNSFYPPRIDDDIIITQNPQDCRTLFLAKYDDNGIMQWIKRPQPVGVDQTLNYSSTASRALQTDADGNNYWLVILPPDTYEGGAFVNTMPGANFFILKYDAQGNYIGNIPLNIQATGAFGYLNLYRNKYNGSFYIVSRRLDSSDTAIVGGNTITHSTFMACFDAQGNFQWVREDTLTQSGGFYIYNLDFDSQSNIYIGGKIVGFGMNNFLGFSVPESIIPGFVMKTNPTATQVLWSSYNNKGSQNNGGIVLNGDELGYTSYCFANNFTWGTQVLDASGPNQGQEALLARFNKDTGDCIALTKIPGSVGFNDVGTSITADASGDYILGGAIGGALYFNNSQQIVNSGSQSDFFVAKYATETCSPLTVNNDLITAPTFYPNPTKAIVQFDNSNLYFQKATVYNYLGQEMLKPFDCNQSENVTLDLNCVSNGVYIIKLDGLYGSKSVKVVKE